MAVQREMDRRWWATSKREAHQIKRLLSLKLGQLGLDYIFNLDGRKQRKFVKFQSCEITRDRYIYQVDSRHLPRGVAELSMTKEEVLTGLMCSLHKPVSYHLSQDGLFFLIDREGGLADIPKLIQYEEIINNLRNSDGPLVIPLGMMSSRRIAKIDLQNDTTAHFLIGGTTGAGKTNAVHVMICTLAQRSPQEVKLVLVDLKGFEFPQYAKLPHLDRPIVTEPGQVLEVLEDIWEECERRKHILQKDISVRNIKAYNARRELVRRLPYLVVVFDEFSSVMLDKTIKHRDEIESILARIAGLSRAVGIHLVIATQRPSKEVLTGLITANFPGRIALACTEIAHSMTIIGNGDACFREEVPAGRSILGYGRHRVQFQIAFLSDGRQKEIISNAVAGKFGLRKMYHDVTMAEMAAWAQEHRNWNFDQEALYVQFKDRGVTQEDVREMSRMYRSQPFDMCGEQYILRQADRRKPVFIVKFSGQSSAVVNQPEGEGTSTANQPTTKQAKSLDKAFDYLITNPRSSSRDLAKALGVSPFTAQSRIRKLQAEGRIRKNGNGWERVETVDAEYTIKPDDPDDEFADDQKRYKDLIGESDET